MKLILRYMKPYLGAILFGMLIKLIGTTCELMIPYILEHMIDNIVPLGDIKLMILWGIIMMTMAFLTRTLNVIANRKAVWNAHNVSYDVRKDLFDKTMNLSGTQFDEFGLPSLDSRMTSDSYNVQSCAQSLQTMCVRAPIMLFGGIIVTMTMDFQLSLILCAMVPLLLIVVLGVSKYGIPLFHIVQEKLDDIVLVMRENITGIRVVKALSKGEYEKNRFHEYNERMTQSDIKANTFMAIPGPSMQLCLNVGLCLVVALGAYRVNAGLMKSGVILAFLTYFNYVMMGVMSLNRLFVMVSKASASANRIDQVLSTNVDQKIYSLEETTKPESEDFIVFDHVNFKYSQTSSLNANDFAGMEQEQVLYDINFTIKKGESLGIIGPTGCGKTTIINLLMRFYDVEDGNIYLDGKDVRCYEKDELHRKFGVVFQNDIIFNNTLRENIKFGREINDEQINEAIKDAMAKEFVDGLDYGLNFKADIKGANMSGGQKQRILISRALAGNNEILILDDSSSALDYKTDASLRKAIFENHKNATTIMIAQRVSSIQSMTHILVMDNGHCIGYGTHQELLESCPAYKEIYDTQMGALG